MGDEWAMIGGSWRPGEQEFNTTGVVLVLVLLAVLGCLVLKAHRPSRNGTVRLYVSPRATCRRECQQRLIGWNRTQNLRAEREKDPEGYRKRMEELAANGRRARAEKALVKKSVNLELRDGEED